MWGVDMCVCVSDAVATSDTMLRRAIIKSESNLIATIKRFI